MAGNTVNLEFAGDAAKLAKASKDAQKSIAGVNDAVMTQSDNMADASKSSDNYLDRVGKLGAGIEGMSTAVDNAGAAVQALADLQNAGRERAARLARAANDVRQATEDMAQATRDASQAQIDSKQAVLDEEQARLDQSVALKDYNKAVKEHGKNSDEAKQAQIDLKQAGIDLKQAQEDSAQATRDASQASIDAEAAQLDLNDAQAEAHPPEMQQWADQISMITPLITGLMGVVGLITAAQWLWNAALLASPLTWIVLAIAAVIAIIVIIATKTTWFQDIWKAAWGGIRAAALAVGRWFRDTLWGKYIKGAWDSIKSAGESVWDWMKSVPGKLKTSFSKVTSFLFAPFRAAFNLISDAWNNTIGGLHWQAPAILGGFSVSVPNLPHFHSGGVVGGPPGSEQLAVLQAGERVLPATSSGGAMSITINSGGSRMDNLLVEILADAIRRQGGNVQAVLGTGG